MIHEEKPIGKFNRVLITQDAEESGIRNLIEQYKVWIYTQYKGHFASLIIPVDMYNSPGIEKYIEAELTRLLKHAWFESDK